MTTLKDLADQMPVVDDLTADANVVAALPGDRSPGSLVRDRRTRPTKGSGAMDDSLSRYLRFVEFTAYEKVWFRFKPMRARTVGMSRTIWEDALKEGWRYRQLGKSETLANLFKLAQEQFEESVRAIPFRDVEFGRRLLGDTGLPVDLIEHLPVAHAWIHDRNAVADWAAVRDFSLVTADVVEAQSMADLVRKYGAQFQVPVRASGIDLHERSSGRPASRAGLTMEAAVESASNDRGGPFGSDREVRSPRLQSRERSGQLLGLIPTPRIHGRIEGLAVRDRDGTPARGVVLGGRRAADQDDQGDWSKPNK